MASWAALPGAAPRTDQPAKAPALRDVLDRAAAAAVAFGADLQGVVARERYTQTIRAWPGAPPDRPSIGAPLESRVLIASLLLVHDPATPWQLHRDVVEVDGAAVTDRGDRLAALFADRGVDPASRLRQITEESARFNLGHVTRTINVPTFPLLVVHPAHQDRFRFADRGRALEPDGTPVRLVSFRERGRPRVVRGRSGEDVQLRGELAIDEATGDLLRSTLVPEAGHLRARLEVTWGRVAALPRRVPVAFWEWYRVDDVPERDRFVEGEARYDDFRRYATAVGVPVVR